MNVEKTYSMLCNTDENEIPWGVIGSSSLVDVEIIFGFRNY